MATLGMNKMKITKRQLRRIIREAGRTEHDAEARGMAAAYRQGYNDAYRGPGFKRRGGGAEYRRGYEKGVADVEQGKPPPDDFRPARRIREAEGSTKKYDDDSALKGGQSKLPDGLQKGIIDKTVEDREQREEEERKEKNESIRITRSQLRRIIKEEKQKMLNEWGSRPETGLPLIDFANAYAGLGDAVQSQVDAVVAAYVNGGGPDSENFRETVYEQNPNAIDMAMERIGRLYLDDSDDYQQIVEALEYAQSIYEEGDAEVEADAMAAGDR